MSHLPAPISWEEADHSLAFRLSNCLCLGLANLGVDAVDTVSYGRTTEVTAGGACGFRMLKPQDPLAEASLRLPPQGSVDLIPHKLLSVSRVRA
jgi:hypothetical protein